MTVTLFLCLYKIIQVYFSFQLLSSFLASLQFRPFLYTFHIKLRDFIIFFTIFLNNNQLCFLSSLFLFLIKYISSISFYSYILPSFSSFWKLLFSLSQFFLKFSHTLVLINHLFFTGELLLCIRLSLQYTGWKHKVLL